MIKAADRFHTQNTRVNEMWQTDLTYFKIIGRRRSMGRYELNTGPRARALISVTAMEADDTPPGQVVSGTCPTWLQPISSAVVSVVPTLQPEAATMDTDKDISTLNGLIKITFDSVKGYEDAAEVSEGRFKTLFQQLGGNRRHVVSQLQDEVRRLGGKPENDGSLMGAAHRAFLNLKQSVSSNDEKAIVNEVERGEDYLKEKYEEALKDRDVSPQTSSVIERAYASVREGHDSASALKHNMAH